MLRIISIFVLFIFLSEENVFAQQRTIGPQAKFKGINKAEKKASILYFTNHDHSSVKGPEAKNNTLDHDQCNYEVVKFATQRKLTGPKAKNTRPEDEDYWLKETEDE